MRPTIPVFLSLILLAGLLPASAEANAIKCVKLEFVQCRCKSPYRIRCSNAEGFVQWNVPVTAVGILIRDRSGTIKASLATTLNPPEVRGFNLHTVHEGDAFREHLESMGKLPRGHSYEIRDFWLSNRFSMFNGTNMEDRMGTIAEVNRRMEPPARCFYTREPFAVEIGPDGYKTVICVGAIQCRPRNGGGEYTSTAICLAQGDVGSCPNATSCAAEEVPEIQTFEPIIPRSRD